MEDIANFELREKILDCMDSNLELREKLINNAKKTYGPIDFIKNIFKRK